MNSVLTLHFKALHADPLTAKHDEDEREKHSKLEPDVTFRTEMYHVVLRGESL